MLKYPIPPLPSTADLCTLAVENEQYRDWYFVAGRNIESKARELAVNYTDLCAYLALFSPRCAVSRSCKLAVDRILGRPFSSDVVKSRRAAVEYWERTGIIRGPKTYQFYDALRGNPHAIVLDTHMANLLGVPHKRLGVKAVREACAFLIQTVANKLRWPNREIQSCLWAGQIKKQPYGNVRYLEFV